jgi:hypothetical protein
MSFPPPGLQVIREVEVEIRFSGSREPGRARQVPKRTSGWDETFDHLLVNPGSARTFRSRPSPAPLSAQVGPGDTYVRVRFGATGLCRLAYADLLGGGWPAGVPVTDVRVEERGYDKNLADPFTVTNLPRRVEDTNQNGIFDDGDYLLFYGFNYQDRFNPPIADSRYSYFHSYWGAFGEAGADCRQNGVSRGRIRPRGLVPQICSSRTGSTSNPEGCGSSFPICDTLWLNQDQRPPTSGRSDLAQTNFGTGRGGRVTPGSGTHIVSLDLNGQVLLAEAPPPSTISSPPG